MNSNFKAIKLIFFSPIISLTMTLNLLPHQEELVSKMCQDEDTYQASVNFSTMGLGKSACAIALMKARPKNFNLLVVPKNIVQNWKNEIKKFTEWTVMVFDRRYSDIEKIIDYDVVITTYDLLYSRGVNGSLKTALHEVEFDRILFDECHLIRNGKTKRFQSASLLNGDCKVLLSGTPISGAGTQIQEFNNYCELLRVDRDEFKELYQRKTLNDVEGMPEVNYKNRDIELSPEHRAIFEQLGLFLPPADEQFNWVEYIREKFEGFGITPDVYEPIVFANQGLVKYGRKKYTLSGPNMLLDMFNKYLPSDALNFEKIQRFDDEKLNKLNYLDRMVKPNEKTLIITNYKIENELIYDRLANRGLNVQRINGDTKQEERDNIIEKSKFKFTEIFEGENNRLSMLPFDMQEEIYKNVNTDVVVANCSCVAVGVNLQHFSNLIIYSVPNSAINYAQVLARIVRIGSPYKKVNISTLYYDDTLEEDILRKHAAKMQKFDNLDEIIENY